MKRISAVILLTLIICGAVSAQPGPDTLWTKLHSPGSHGYSVKQTSDGGYIITGQSYLWGEEDWDLYFLKTDSEGDYQMDLLVGGELDEVGHCVYQTPDGGYISAGFKEIVPDSNYKAYVVKVNNYGFVQWERTYGEPFDYTVAYGLTEAGGNCWVITGHAYNSFVDSSWTYLAKIDSDGDTIWTKTIADYQFQLGVSVQETSDGGFIIAGESRIDLIHNYPSLTKTNAAGNRIWTRVYEDATLEAPYIGNRVVQTNDGGYALLVSDNIGGSSQFVLIKTDSDGNELWRRDYGTNIGDFPYSLDLTSDGGFVMTGGQGVYIVKADSAGNQEWEKTVSGGTESEGHSIQQTNDDGYIVVGYQGFIYGGFGQCYIWLVRLDSEVPTLYVDLIPDDNNIEIPPEGGSFDYTVRVVNSGSNTERFDIWTEIELPNIGSVPIFNVENITLAAQTTVERDRTQYIPGYAPAGVYTYLAYIGDYPWMVDFTDSFEFEKEGSDDGYLGNPLDWTCSGELFTNEKVSAITSQQPDQFALDPAQPNPFNPETILSFNLPEDSDISLVVYDIQGREVAVLLEGWQNAGIYRITFDASNLPSGMYIARLNAGEYSQAQKLLLIK